MYKFYHNPRCRKSRETLKILKENVAENKIEIVEYLKTPPTKKELKNILSLLGISAFELIRKKEKDFSSYKKSNLSEEKYIDLMLEFPKLIERPIVIAEKKAILGRPPENILKLV
jgi:arsenate reductase